MVRVNRAGGWSLLVVFVALGGCRDAPADTPEPSSTVDRAAAVAAAATITPEDLYDRIALLAADSMRGRDTPSPELDAVAEWIAGEFERFGLQPGMEEGYIQRYALRRMTVDASASSLTVGDASLAWGADLTATALPREGLSEGPVVLLSGSDGEVADLPGEAQVFVFAGPGMEATRGPSWPARVEGLFAAGAGAVYVVTTLDDERWTRSAERAARGSRVVGEVDADRTTSMLVREAAVRRALGARGIDVDALQARQAEEVRIDVTDVASSSTIRLDILEDATAPNVVGILEGSDPELRDEYVVYSAHMDHVGVRPSAEGGDSIFNGADDDASGTAAVIEVAEAMASLDVAPRRSMIFLLVSGEEKGLLGSGYFADHPPVAVEAMVANLNADMVGRNWSDTIVAIGKEHSDLGETLARVNEAYPDLGMTAIDDIWPDERFYFRSDHFNFARKGVPVLFFFNGTHEDYHRASDEVDKIDTEKTARIGRLLFHLGLEIAAADERPRWNPDSYADIVEDAGG
ncbi:MAG: M28 family peptidase [Gemmatimonadetes bacterium]|nr:M28 family peptidase [Gemmatimonadota bacterium]